ncbi:MAG TPA: DNA/RNA helicase domain-containing protein [Actinomycetota bacterium]|nr:DNA/RNA helicase domain-containing protein [Actinomycetota bacterium]
MSALMPAYGWAGTAQEFLDTDLATWKGHLSEHLAGSLGWNPAGTQSVAWEEEYAAVRTALEAVPSNTKSWKVIFEFELPLEGGRRPDVIVHTGSVIFVIEFKTAHQPRPPHLDQVREYVRDLGSYHQASHGIKTVPVLAISGARNFLQFENDVWLSSFDRLHEILREHKGEGEVDLDAWLSAPYAPLPTLIAAAKRIFNHDAVPHVFTAQSAGIPETLELISNLVHEARAKGEKKLILVTGVPGSGKTLVGLRMVYERSLDEEPATFLSGNGPLVKVLQSVLQSRVFVRDLHAFIKTNAVQGRTPLEHVIVFDEAQRAWDRGYMQLKKGVPHSEPELLVQIGDKMQGWAVLIGLVGEGQEIFSGEEAGMGQWREAVELGGPGWTVHCSPEVQDIFGGLSTTSHQELDLNVSLRSERLNACTSELHC